MASLVRKVTGQVTGQAPERSDSRGDPDRLRTGFIRYAGYANEVGEAFRPLVPRAAVNASYVAASGYVVADAAWRANTLPTSSPRSPSVEVVDTLIWQGLASVIIPGEPFSAMRNRQSEAAPLATAAVLAVSLAPQESMRVLGYLLRLCLIGMAINRIVWAVGRVSPASIVKWSPTAAGLCCIPFIIKPIDHGVDLLMESVFRPFYPGAAGGAEKSE